MKLIKQVVVNLSVEGFHHWKDAFDEVDFLRFNHRHSFHIKALKHVSHNDRDIEIILLKRSILSYLKAKYGEPCLFGQMSCESIAEDLVEHFNLTSCEVLEDGENGAKITQVQ